MATKLKKSILLLHQGGEFYGSDKVFYQVINALYNDHCLYVVLDNDGPLREKISNLNVQVSVKPLGILRRKYFNIKGLLFLFRTYLSTFYFLLNLHRKNKFDLVYSNTAGVIIGPLFSSLCGLINVWHIHEIIETPKPINKCIALIIEFFSTKTIFISNAVKICYLKKKVSTKYQVVYNSITMQKSNLDMVSKYRYTFAPNDEIVIGVIGRIHYWKGQDYFISIANILSKQFNNINFAIVGDVYPGYEYLLDELKTKVEKYDLTSRVKIISFQSDNFSVIESFDILVLPSTLPEPFGLVLIEGMACSKPVVATGHGGALEIINDGQNGILIPWDDDKVAAEKIASYIIDENKRIQISNQAKIKYEESFNISRFNHEIRSLIDNLLNRN